MSRAESTNQLAKNAPIKAYFIHHLRTLIASLGVLSRNPLSTSMTVAVIAIALALPSGLYVMLSNASKVSVGWDNSSQISLFLKAEVDEKAAEALAKKLRLYEDIKSVKLIHRDQALKEFQKVSGFGDAINSLDNNPLPHVLAIQPVLDQQRPDKIRRLLKDLDKLKQVDIAQLDLQWVKRLYTMLEIARKGIWIISLLLG
ncbi:MAG: permease-like cell division protein FtsX, partial [Gammaproteobacteria bacterium]|nr:permease-like cell division protein FtsX [Gammaproteobacteria bacterium]